MPVVIYPPVHQADMVYIYGLCRGNSAEAAREYQRRHPDRRHPNPRVFARKRSKKNKIKRQKREPSASEDEDEDSESSSSAEDKTIKKRSQKKLRKRQKRERSASEHDEDEERSLAEEKAHYTTDKELQKGKLRLSSDVLIPESTNITLDQELLMDLHELSDKIQNFYPVLAGGQFTLCFKGETGDNCEYIFTSASDTRRNGERHSGSRCGECEANIIGFRYKCVTCADYDLCSACEALGIHAQHVMMRIAKPLESKQARVMVQRCCDVMKAGVLSATVNKFAGNTSGVDTVNSSVDMIVEASTSEEASPNKSKTAQTRRSTKELFVKNLVPSKTKASTTTDGSDDKQEKTNEDRKRKAEASEDEEEMKPTVKEEPDDTDLASNYNSFTDTVSEPLVVTEEVKVEDLDPLETVSEPLVVTEEVKVEDPDPLETEITIKVEQPTSAGTSSWSADNYTEPAAAVESSDTSRPEEDTASVCLTYTHKRTKNSSDLIYIHEDGTHRPVKIENEGSIANNTDLWEATSNQPKSVINSRI